MLAIVLGIATAALVFAAEKGVDNYVCARKAEARYDADEFDDDNDIFCEEAPPPQERYQGRVCPDLFGRIQKVQDERLAESIRQGQELEELQKPDIEKSEDNHYVDIPEDVIDHVFKDVKPQDEPAEEPQESAEEESDNEAPAAPERDEKGRFKKK
jgi:hypothetical protein